MYHALIHATVLSQIEPLYKLLFLCASLGWEFLYGVTDVILVVHCSR